MKIFDLYTDYIQITMGAATATGLSNLLDNQISHDQITRALAKLNATGKDVWHNVKSLVRQHEADDACLIFDDSIIHKPYTDENDIVCWHYDHCQNRNVKGMNLLTAFYHTQSNNEKLPLKVPIAFEVIHKYQYCDIETKKEKRVSPVTKNELMRDMINQAIRNQLKFKYILADSWFGANENMRFIHKKKKYFIFDIKTNRLVTIMDRNKGSWARLDSLSILPNTPTRVWLKDLEIQVLLMKQVFTNKDNSTGVRYLVSNNLNLIKQDFEDTYKKRWSVEEYHKSIKQNTAISKSPTRTIATQTAHIFASIISYIKFEKYKFSTKLNHFALKSKLYYKATKTAFSELMNLKLQHEKFEKLYNAA